MRSGTAVLALVLVAIGFGGACAQEAGPPAASATTAPERGTLALTLQDAIALARRNNPNLRIAAEDVDLARARAREVRAQRGVDVTASASYRVQGPVQSFQFQVPGGPSQRVVIVPQTDKLLSAQLTFPTDLAGRLRARQRAADLTTQAEQSGLRATENDLVFSVTEAYAAVLRAAELVRVRQEAVGAAREQLRVAEAQFRAGVVPQFDVLRASVQVENLRQELIAAENVRATAEARLISILNIEPAVELKLTPLMAPPATPEAPPAEGDAAAAPRPQPPAPQAPGALPEPRPEPLILGEGLPAELPALLEQAFRQRAEVDAAQRSLSAAEQLVRFERRARNPDVSINANVNYDPDVSGFAAEKTTYGATALLTLSVFDSGLIRARVRQAQSQEDAARARLEQVRQSVAQDVRTALTNLREARARLATAGANVTQAREALRIARVRYQAGVSTTVEVTDAEVALTQAQTNQVNAEYDVIVAQAGLNRAIGRTET
jgi:outer membrane protein